MEHKIIQGGEIHLPFARSRIKALRATGQAYASQRFLMPDGAEVHAQIEGDIDRIHIKGGSDGILSGVTQGGELITLPSGKKTMRSYRATAQAAQYAGGGSPTTFHDMKRLAVLPEVSIGVGGATQYENLCPSMYSGTMAKVVQILMGYGKTKGNPIDGVKVKYKYTWATCHGVTTASDGRKWLVEISNSNGVIAMPLPMTPAYPGIGNPATNKQDVIKQTYLLLGGFPTGGTFPEGAALTAAISAGTVLQLLTASDLDAYYTKAPMSFLMGWSFNNAGTEAHNTCASSTNGIVRGAFAGDVTGHHYKIEISIGTDSGTATLSEVESGPLIFSGAERCFATYEFTSGYYEGCPGKQVAFDSTELDAPINTPVFVCHIDDTLEVLRIRSNDPSLNTAVSTGASPPYGPTYIYTYTTDTRRYVASTTYPDNMNFYEHEYTASFTEHSQHIGYVTIVSYYYERADERHYTVDYVDTTDTARLSHAIWSPRARDCYVIDRDFGDKVVATIKDNQYISKYGSIGYHHDSVDGSRPITIEETSDFPVNRASWADGAWAYTPPVGTWNNPEGDTIQSTWGALTISNPMLGSGGFTYPSAESFVYDNQRATARPLIVLTASGHTVSPINYSWNFGIDYDWNNIQARAYPFDVRYSVFGELPQIAYPESTLGSAPTAVFGSAFLDDASPRPSAVKYSFIGYVK